MRSDKQRAQAERFKHSHPPLASSVNPPLSSWWTERYTNRAAFDARVAKESQRMAEARHTKHKVSEL